MQIKQFPNKILYRYIKSKKDKKRSEELLEKRQVEFVISTNAIDLFRTSFVQKGGNLGRFAEDTGGVVIYNHLSDSGDPDDEIGVGYAYREGDQTIGLVQFEKAEINEKADRIFRKIQNGMPYMASVGVQPTKATYGVKDEGENPNILYFREWNLLEFSVVPIGANPEAEKRNLENLNEFRNYQKIDQKTEPIKPLQKVKTRLNHRQAQILINQYKS